MLHDNLDFHREIPVAIFGTNLAQEILRLKDLVPETGLDQDLTRSESPVPILIHLGGEEHHKRRKAVAVPFSTPKLETWRSAIEEISADVVNTLSDVVSRRESVDLAPEFAWPIVTSSISLFSGLPYSETEELLQIGRLTVDSECSSARRKLAGVRLYRLMLEAVARERERHIGHDGPQHLIDYFDTPFASDEDVFGVLITILGGGASVLVRALLACVRAEADNSKGTTGKRLGSASERALCKYPVVEWVHRRAVEDLNVGKVPIRRGEHLDVRIVDPEQEPGDGIGAQFPFGFGAHFCLGAALSRLVCDAATKALLDQFRVTVIGFEESAALPLAHGMVRMFTHLERISQ